MSLTYTSQTIHSGEASGLYSTKDATELATVLNAMNTALAALNGKGVLNYYSEVVDTSGGGTAQTEALVTVPAGALILDVVTTATATFNGDTTTTFEVGIAANTDKYIDPSDASITAGGQMNLALGTNQDQKAAELTAVSTPIIATWTNTASATTGGMRVDIVYIT